MKVGDPCSLCKFGQIKEKFHTVGSNNYKNLQCDVCGARFCQECGGTLNVRGSSSKYKNQCLCEAGEALVDKGFVFTDEDLEEVLEEF